MTTLLGALAWRAAKLWVVVRIAVTGLVMGGRTFQSVLGGSGVQDSFAPGSLFDLDPTVLFVMVVLIAVLMALDVRRSGGRILLANLGIGMLHVCLIAAVTAGVLEAVVHLAGGAL